MKYAIGHISLHYCKVYALHIAASVKIECYMAATGLKKLAMGDI